MLGGNISSNKAKQNILIPVDNISSNRAEQNILISGDNISLQNKAEQNTIIPGEIIQWSPRQSKIQEAGKGVCY